MKCWHHQQEGNPSLYPSISSQALCQSACLYSQQLIKDKSLTLNQAFNCVEMGLYWKLMPNKTFVTSRERAAKSFKKPKDWVTLRACANATGSIKLPLVFIHKSLNPRCFKNINKKNLPVHYYALKSSWVVATNFKTWFQEKFVPQCCRALEKKDLP